MKAEPGKPLTLDQFGKLISNEITFGLQYVYGPDMIAAERDRNFEYRRGVMNDVPVARNGSAVTDRTVGAYIDLMKPSLLRIFTSGRNIGEYVSPKEELTDTVREITRYVNDVVLRKDNRGELFLNDWAEDALVQKLGTVMGWWEERWESHDETMEGIPDMALASVGQDIDAKGGEVVAHTPTQVVAQVQTPIGPQAIPHTVHAITVRTKVNKSKLCVDVIPPEEYVISRDARNDDDAVLEGHRTGAMVGDLVAQGLPLDIINELPTYSTPYADRLSKYNRDNTTQNNRDSSADPMLRKVGVVRGRVRCDYDGTGLKDWFFVAGGEVQNLKILKDPEPYNYQVFFANFCPQPVPHTVYGRCPADDLTEIQKVRTVILRQILQNAYLHNTPQREVVADLIVKPDQLMNLAPGAPVLVKAPNAIREMQVPFAGPAMLQVMQYFEGEAELRTGVGRNTAGLDPEVLTNQSATANANMQSAMQGRIEMIARIWRDGGMRKMFRGILRCLIAYHDFPREVQMSGKMQTIDPRKWAGLQELDININTGLGTGNRAQDVAFLTGISAQQEKVIDALGPDNPICDLQKAVRTKQMICEAGGISNPEAFFGDAKNADGSDWKPPPPPPPEPSPDVVAQGKALVASEQVKAQSAEKRASEANQLEREKTVAQITSNERIAMDKNYRDYDIELKKLNVAHAEVIIRAAEVDAENIRTDMEKGKAA